MREAAAVRRARLVLSIGLPALGAVIAIPSFAAWLAHDSPGRLAATRQAADAGPRPGTRHQAAAPQAADPRPAARRSPRVPSRADGELAGALTRALRGRPGRLAAGVIDEHTGAMAAYHGSWPFSTASIVKADILAVLLIQHQQIGTPLSSAERRLATAMIEDSDNNAATTLWNDVEGGMGLEAGNAVLGLRHTWPSLTGAWGLTTTTITDQLRLLTDLTSARSPLDAASRAYELSLMRHVEAGQGWGVTAAADPGSSPAVKNGWLPVSPGWVINSIGVVTHVGHQLLIAVLSTGAPTENDGISQVQAAARATAAATTGAPSPPPGYFSKCVKGITQGNRSDGGDTRRFRGRNDEVRDQREDGDPDDAADDGGMPDVPGNVVAERRPLRELIDDRVLDELLERSRDEAGGLRLTGASSMLGELVKAVLERVPLDY